MKTITIRDVWSITRKRLKNFYREHRIAAIERDLALTEREIMERRRTVRELQKQRLALWVSEVNNRMGLE